MYSGMQRVNPLRRHISKRGAQPLELVWGGPLSKLGRLVPAHFRRNGIDLGLFPWSSCLPTCIQAESAAFVFYVQADMRVSI